VRANATMLRCADTFGSDMGKMSDGTETGKLLMRDSWNARPYGPLYDAQVEGVKNGTDFYFHKSKVVVEYSGWVTANAMLDRLSGLWGAQTPLGTWLEENQMTTLFFGGVNADQCVVCSPDRTCIYRIDRGDSGVHS
jgi:nicotinamidase-related amidase